jgi:hypothetical protein
LHQVNIRRIYGIRHYWISGSENGYRYLARYRILKKGQIIRPDIRCIPRKNYFFKEKYLRDLGCSSTDIRALQDEGMDKSKSGECSALYGIERLGTVDIGQ